MSLSLRLSARDRRILTLGAVTVVVLLAGARGIPAWRQWRAATWESAAELSAEVSRAQATATRLPALRAEHAALRGRYLALAPTLLPGRTPASAGAALTGLVSGAGALSGVRLGALQILTDPASGSSGAGVFRRVTVRGDATGDVAGVTRLLAALERGPARLAIRELSIQQPEPAAPPDRAESLRAEFIVQGLMLVPQDGKTP